MSLVPVLISLSISPALATPLWEPDAAAYATKIEIKLVLSSAPAHDNFTRELTFTSGSSEKKISIPFTYQSALHYSGSVSSGAELDELNEMVPSGNRSFWDDMSFHNYGGTTTLNISTMEVWITYADLNNNHEETMMIGYATSATLAAPTGSIALSQLTGRRYFFRDYMGDQDYTWGETADMSLTEFNALPSALRYMVYDLGKSGSDTGTGNPKYGDDESLCSETISWYYHEYGEWLTSEDFEDISVHVQMADAFDAENRLYCYSPTAGAFRRWRTFPGPGWVTYTPQPGDYLDRADEDPGDGHAMMIVDWDAVDGVATIMDGPTIALGEVFVDDQEVAGTHDYCVGRIPSND